MALKICAKCEKRSGDKLRVYYCGCCQGYHLTKEKSDVQKAALCAP